MTTDKDTDVTPGYGQPVNNCPIPKRFGLGTKFYSNGISVPEIVEKPDGEYVRFDDYDKLAAHHQYAEAMWLYHKSRADKLEAKTLSNELLHFLRGSAPMEGVWFGDSHPSHKGNFWWRKLLPEPVDELRSLEKEPSGPTGRLLGNMP